VKGWLTKLGSERVGTRLGSIDWEGLFSEEYELGYVVKG